MRLLHPWLEDESVRLNAALLTLMLFLKSSHVERSWAISKPFGFRILPFGKFSETSIFVYFHFPAHIFELW